MSFFPALHLVSPFHFFSLHALSFLSLFCAHIGPALSVHVHSYTRLRGRPGCENEVWLIWLFLFTWALFVAATRTVLSLPHLMSSSFFPKALRRVLPENPLNTDTSPLTLRHLHLHTHTGRAKASKCEVCQCQSMQV